LSRGGLNPGALCSFYGHAGPDHLAAADLSTAQRGRFDGVHFSVYCAELAEPQVLGAVRKMLG
jgi:hypothetical protein